MDSLISDLRHAARRLAAAPGFTLAAALCVAIGVGATTTIFSLVNALVLRPLPGLTDPGRLVEVGRTEDGRGSDTFSYPNFTDLATDGEALEELAAWELVPLGLGGGTAEPAVALGMAVSGNYFGTLGVKPWRGRFFAPGESRIGAVQPVAVLGYSRWRRLGADPGIVGQGVKVNGLPVTVIGVAPPGFRGTLAPLEPDLWVPLGMQAPGLPAAATFEHRANNSLLAFGRLRPGVSVDQAQARLDVVMERLVAEYSENRGQGVLVSPLGGVPAAMRAPVALFLSALMVVVGLLLLIACVNVAGMLLVRSLGRAREVAVRQALGASRGRLLQQLLTESLLLFALGGAGGVLLALWTTRLLAAFDPPLPPPFDIAIDLSLDLRVLSFALAISLLTGVLFGLRPALAASRTALVPALRNEAGAGPLRRAWGRYLLVGGQVAMTLLLLLGSGLFLRALQRARALDAGFDPAGVSLVSFDLELQGYTEAEGRDFQLRLLERVRGLPGVEAASLVRVLPLGMPSRLGWGGVSVEGFAAPGGETTFPADVNVVSADYFRTLRLPLLQGRDFGFQDEEGAPLAAVINQTMAGRFWPQGAVGRRLTMGGPEGDPYEVVGVVADAKYARLLEETPMFVYAAAQQHYEPGLTLLTRSRPATGPLISDLRRVVDQLDPALPVVEAMPLGDYVRVGFLPQRITAAVAGLLGGVGLLLGAVGIFGATAYSVSRRSREMGLRKALGARDADIVHLVVRQGMTAPLAGIAIGLALAWGVSRFLESLLFGVSPLDAPAFAAAVAVLVAAALLASYLPARRAAAMEPMEALRFE